MSGVIAVPNLERARAVYRSIRNCWITSGGALEAHERLGVITVAAEVRDFAFLNEIGADSRPTVVQVLTANGLSAEPCSFAFDLDFETVGVSQATVDAYRRTERARSPLSGLGVWSGSAAVSGCAGMMSLGATLSYPPCCEMMDLRTKQKDHELFLVAIVEKEGDDVARIERALLERREYCKASYDHCHEWNDRFVRTHSSIHSSSTQRATTVCGSTKAQRQS